MTIDFDGKPLENDIMFSLQDLLIEKEKVIDIEEDRCYVGVFPNTGTQDQALWYFGALYLQKYYTYFSAGNETVLP